MNNTTRLRVVEAFENFDKWETYGTVFDLMTQRKCTLRDIQEIAAAVGWKPIGANSGGKPISTPAKGPRGRDGPYPTRHRQQRRHRRLSPLLLRLM